MDLLKSGAVDGVVSAGHSGAVVAAALLTLGRIPGVSRPALGTRLPITPRMAFALDIGAVIDPKPEVLLQYGYLGSAYARSVLGVENPTVALLSNGEEASKGNALIKSARELYERAPGLNFVGNVEGQDVLHSPPNVTVTDGFTGNIALKTAEGTAIGIQRVLRDELTSTRYTKALAMLLRPAFRRLRTKIDIEGIGGAPLLGVNGVVVVSHGRSTASALVNAITTATHAAEVGLPVLQRDAIPARLPTVPETEPSPTVATADIGGR
jgi:glycerol-3-phosphate acyltransferase PlsX